MVARVIYTTEDCPLCNLAKDMYPDAEVRDVEDLQSGKIVDMDAMVQLSMQNMALPVIRLGEQYIKPSELKAEVF